MGVVKFDDGKVIHTFPKNSIDEIRIVTFEGDKGKEYVDFREYYRADNGEMRPTKKGLFLNRDLLSDLEEGFKKLREVSLEELANQKAKVRNG